MAGERDGPVTVLCITGWCRNGSTIIGNILNEAHDFIHVGELHFLWKNAVGLGANNLCGCGLELGRCAFWSQILPLGRPAGTSAEYFAAEVVRRQRACVRTRHTWRILRRGLGSVGLRAHAELMTQVYRAIAERSGARVIVDTSKMPGEAALLAALGGEREDTIRPLFVHLVRDPRATALSWHQPKQYVYALPASASTAYWCGFNLAASAITKRHAEHSMALRYEEFIADPAGVIGHLLRFCGADPAVSPMTGRTVELHGNHTVTGNPDRFRTGATVVRDTDDGWRTELSRRPRLAASALSWPLRLRYGYLRERAKGGAGGERARASRRAPAPHWTEERGLRRGKAAP